VRGGDPYILELKSGTAVRLANTVQCESNPYFNHDGTRVFLQQGDNPFSMSPDGSGWTQLSNFTRDDRGSQRSKEAHENTQTRWVKADQLDLFAVLQTRRHRDSLEDARRRDNQPEGEPRRIDVGNAMVTMQQVSPSGRYISYQLVKRAESNTNTIVP